MKTYLSVLILFLASPVFAAEMCIQMIQPAVGPTGECQEFSTPCEVPDGWRSVPSCEEVKPRDYGMSPDELLERRRQQRIEALHKRAQELEAERAASDKESTTYARGQRRASFPARLRSSRRAIQNSTSNRLRRSLPDYSNRTAYERAQKHSLKSSSYKMGNEKTKLEKREERIIERGTRRPSLQSRTDAVREGFLQNEPNLYERQSMRYKRHYGQRRDARTFYAEQRRKAKEAKPEKEYEGIQLRKLYRGERLEGDIEGALLDIE